jgi:hypothetical protein
VIYATLIGIVAALALLLLLLMSQGVVWALGGSGKFEAERQSYLVTPEPAGSRILLLKSSTSFTGAQMASVTPENNPFHPKKVTSLDAIRLKVLLGCVQGAGKFFGS